MSFFSSDHKIKTEDLRLADYNKIWTKFCFLDETGSLNNAQDPFFTVGIIKLSQPYYLSSKIDYERRKRNFYDEMKFNKLSKHNITFAKIGLDAFLNTRSTHFYSYSVDKEGRYFRREFENDPWRAYEQLTLRLLEDAVLAPQEILILIADYVPSPHHVRYEVTVKKEMNNSLERLALAGVCRFDSRSNDLLQLVDLMIGAVSYDLKTSSGVIKGGSQYKKDFLEFFKEKLEVINFIDGFRSHNFNIFVDKDIKLRLVLNEKGPST